MAHTRTAPAPAITDIEEGVVHPAVQPLGPRRAADVVAPPAPIQIAVPPTSLLADLFDVRILAEVDENISAFESEFALELSALPRRTAPTLRSVILDKASLSAPTGLIDAPGVPNEFSR